MKIFFINLIFILFTGKIEAQGILPIGLNTDGVADGKIQPLSIGDKIPNTILNGVKNYKNNQIRIKDLAGKIIIFDFWKKWCSSCIAMFPKMEALQEKFKEDIQIILVTNDSEADLANLYIKSYNLKNTKLPLITGDSILNGYFPHTNVPYHVWIDKEGVVRAMTNSASTTEGNLLKFIKENKVNVPARKDEMNSDLINSSLFKQIGVNKEQEKQLQSYSIFTKRSRLHVQQLVMSIRNYDDSTGAMNGTRFQNYSIPDLFKQIYPYDSKIIIEPRVGSNRSKYFFPNNPDSIENWNEDNLYCYEYLIPPYINKLSSDERVTKENEMIRTDLEHFFEVKSYIENRSISCLVLHRTSTIDRLKSKGGESSILEKNHLNIWSIRNRGLKPSMRNIVSKFLYTSLENEIPFIDESDYQDKIDMTISEAESVPALNKQLAKYDLVLKFENRIRPCLILKEL